MGARGAVRSFLAWAPGGRSLGEAVTWDDPIATSTPHRIGQGNGRFSPCDLFLSDAAVYSPAQCYVPVETVNRANEKRSFCPAVQRVPSTLSAAGRPASRGDALSAPFQAVPRGG